MKVSYTIEQDTNSSYLVTFPDIPEAVTVLYSLYSKDNVLIDCIETAFEMYADNNRQFLANYNLNNSYDVIKIPRRLKKAIKKHNLVARQNN